MNYIVVRPKSGIIHECNTKEEAEELAEEGDYCWNRE